MKSTGNFDFSLMSYFSSLADWHWLIFGLIILGLEMLIGSGWLIWIGFGSLATGLILLAPIPMLEWYQQIFIFTVFSLIFTFTGRHLWQTKTKQEGIHDTLPDPTLNNRMAKLVGQMVILEEPIQGRRGRLEIGGTSWPITGPDLPIGTQVEITAISGTVLEVQPERTVQPGIL